MQERLPWNCKSRLSLKDDSSSSDNCFRFLLILREMTNARSARIIKTVLIVSANVLRLSTPMKKAVVSCVTPIAICSLDAQGPENTWVSEDALPANYTCRLTLRMSTVPWVVLLVFPRKKDVFQVITDHTLPLTRLITRERSWFISM